jgi:hypothetical protein
MNDDELKRLWRQQKLDPAKLSSAGQIELMRKKMKRMDCVLRWSFVWEIGGAVVLTPVFVWFVWHFLKTPLLARIGVVIIIAGEAFSIWKHVRARRTLPEPTADAPILQWVRDELEKVRVERELDRTALWWSLLPSWIGMNVFFWGLDIEVPARLGCSAVVTAICVVYWKLNQYTQRKHWPALIAELESLLESNAPE